MKTLPFAIFTTFIFSFDLHAEIIPLSDLNCETKFTCELTEEFFISLEGEKFYIRKRSPSDDDYIIAESIAVDVNHWGENISIWPFFASFYGGVILGLERSWSASYSGGGGDAKAVYLVLVPDFGEPKFLDGLLVYSSILVRTCFTEDDAVHRLDACHDVYDFLGKIEIDFDYDLSEPVVTYSSKATYFPKDAVERNPDRHEITYADLVTVVDENCSFTRDLNFNYSYSLDRELALAECSDWLP